MPEEGGRRGGGVVEDLCERFDRGRLQRPGGVILVDEPVQLTSAQLLDLADALAVSLASLGVCAGDVIALQLPNWWETAVVCCAAFRLGATLAALPPHLPDEEEAALLRRGHPRVFFSSDVGRLRARSDLAGTCVAVRSASPGLPSFGSLIQGGHTAPPPGPSRERAPALLLFTSGSTGRPKGVLHGAAALLAKVDDLSAAHELTADDVVLAPYLLSHIGGMVYNLLMPLGIGTRVVLMSQWDPGQALHAVERHGVTFVSAVPTHLHQMMAHESFSPSRVSTIRLAALGGTRVTADEVEVVERTFDAIGKRSYGSTEVPTITTSRNTDPLAKRANTDGAPIGSAQLLIVDERGTPVPPSVEGELCVKGPSILLGYLDPSDGEGAFTEDGWFRTGDLGRVDPDGYLTITGRIKDIIIRGGENLAPAEVERWLIKHPAVEEVAVVGMPDRVLGERACAFIATADDGFTFDIMIAWLRMHGVAPRKLPERLELRRALPTTSTGKVRKDLLRAEIAMLCQDNPGGGDSGP